MTCNAGCGGVFAARKEGEGRSCRGFMCRIDRNRAIFSEMCRTFENILVYANVLLKRMSQGRYQLYRRDNRSKGAGKQGLDLDVLDMESGMIRDVKTLSGGESFKAALSLALGLSKMIQDYAGGIELNTLFIDEGFGSLDSQSLDQAINCLIDLQQDGKLIGIISHVSELKERIDQKIVLTRINKQTKISIE